MLEAWRRALGALREQVAALALAYRDPRTPVAAKLVAACVLAYALSPIDLIPDPIPVLGFLDDLLVLPVGMALAVALVPEDVMQECRARARAGTRADLRLGWIGALVVGSLWVLVIVWVGRALWRIVEPG